VSPEEFWANFDRAEFWAADGTSVASTPRMNKCAASLPLEFMAPPSTPPAPAAQDCAVDLRLDLDGGSSIDRRMDGQIRTCRPLLSECRPLRRGRSLPGRLRRAVKAATGRGRHRFALTADPLRQDRFQVGPHARWPAAQAERSPLGHPHCRWSRLRGAGQRSLE
jgi:hypothetical protein